MTHSYLGSHHRLTELPYDSICKQIEENAKSAKAHRNLIHEYSLRLCERLDADQLRWEIYDHEKDIEMGENKEYHITEIKQLQERGHGCYYYLESGRKYYKLVHEDGHQRSAHCFIDKVTGEVFKAASWSNPAKKARYNLMSDFSRKLCYSMADWNGDYLHERSDNCTYEP
jgi:hypothetical protein